MKFIRVDIQAATYQCIYYGLEAEEISGWSIHQAHKTGKTINILRVAKTDIAKEPV